MVSKHGEETYMEISLIELDRNTKYYSFNSLAKIDYERVGNYMQETGKNYYVFLEAEDKNFNIIAKTSKSRAIAETFSNTNNGILIIFRGDNHES